MARPQPGRKRIPLRRIRRCFWFVAVVACGLLWARAHHHGVARDAAAGLEALAAAKAARPQQPFTTALKRAAAHHVLVNERFRLVLCTEPKVASTEFLKLMHRLGNDTRWRRDPHFRRDAPLLSRLRTREAQRCLEDRNWTWAVFFRDPAERLLSAYLDKFRDDAVANKRYALREFGRDAMTFADFVDAVADTSNATRGSRTGLHPWTNPHWRPQRFLCNNDVFLSRYDFVGSFDRLAADAAALLRRLGAWDQYGRKGWGAHRSRTAIFADAADHATAAAARFAAFYTPDLLAKARAAYAADYAMLDALHFFDAGEPTAGVPVEPLLCRLDPARCAVD